MYAWGWNWLFYAPNRGPCCFPMGVMELAYPLCWYSPFFPSGLSQKRTQLCTTKQAGFVPFPRCALEHTLLPLPRGIDWVMLICINFYIGICSSPGPICRDCYLLRYSTHIPLAYHLSVFLVDLSCLWGGQCQRTRTTLWAAWRPAWGRACWGTQEWCSG